MAVRRLAHFLSGRAEVFNHPLKSALGRRIKAGPIRFELGGCRIAEPRNSIADGGLYRTAIPEFEFANHVRDLHFFVEMQLPSPYPAQ